MTLNKHMVLACAAAFSLAALPVLTAVSGNAATPPAGGMSSVKKKKAHSFNLVQQKPNPDQKTTSEKRKKK